MNFKQIPKTIAHVLVSASFLAALGGFDSGYASQGTAHGSESSAAGATLIAGKTQPDSLIPKNAEGTWTCPMHPEIHLHEPGKCPVCKMKLVKTKPKNV